MLCLVCDRSRVPASNHEAQMCFSCDRGFHPIEPRDLRDVFYSIRQTMSEYL